ncbi:MAG: helix-turn-helix transcriptional regulator [Clostridia bacterium]|nr:helix-turn-helix transcriptional regulator [Clostridia bacterium]
MKKLVYREIGKDAYFKIWHASEEHLLIYMHSDGGSIVCSEKTYPIKSGVLCFIGVGKYHYTMPDEPETYERTKLIFPERMISDLLDGKGFLEQFSKEAFIYAVIPKEEHDEVERLFAEIMESNNDARHRDAIYLHATLKLLILLDRYSIESTQPTSGFINKAIEYICDNIFHELTIDEICAAIHVSKYHFCRSFRAAMNMTVMDYILKTRIVMAESMLRKEHISVTEVSERCGFSSISYFCRVFKQETGKSPLAYRREVQ